MQCCRAKHCPAGVSPRAWGAAVPPEPQPGLKPCKQPHCVNNSSHCQGRLLWQGPSAPPPPADGKGLSWLTPGSRPAPSSTTFVPSLQG